MSGAVRAAVAGTVGLAALLLASTPARRHGLSDLDLPRIVGTAFTTKRGPARAAGWAINLGTGAAFALGYRFAFRLLGGASPAAGALLGLAHGTSAVLFVAVLPKLHPRPASAGLRPFGMLAYGPAAIPGMIVGHVAYGAFVGLVSAVNRRADGFDACERSA